MLYLFISDTQLEKEEEKKIQESSIQISMRSLERDCTRERKREREGGGERNKERRDKSVWMCMGVENRVLESEMREEWDDFF